ncbi:MAG: response regulator [Candidatus Competibacter sp.]|nr:response regulator [Candidatus Competibacter sp.]MDG4583452.1 response regulator [Candidatus Competibacter sp.]
MLLVSEESVAVLEAEVAEALGILEGLPAENDGADQDEITAVLGRYAEQVERIGSAAGEAGFSGLQDICLLFHENLTTLNVRGQGLDDARRERLEEWPILVIGYLMSPNDPEAGEALLEHLQNPAWRTPLPVEEAHILRGLLMPSELAEGREESGEALEPPVEPAALAEPTAVLTEETAVFTEEAAANSLQAESSPPPFLPTPFREEEKPAEKPAIDDSAPDRSLQAGESRSQESEGVTPETPPMEQPDFPTAPPPTPASEPTIAAVPEREPRSDAGYATTLFPAMESQPAAEVAPEALATTVEQTAPTATIESAQKIPAATPPESLEATAEPIEQALESPVAETIIDAQPTTTPEESDSAVETVETESPATPFAPNAAQQELLEIICEEIAQIAEATTETLAIVSAADSTPETRLEAWSGYTEYLERLGEASASINLTGLQQACAHLYANLLELAARDDPPHPEQQRVVEAWPALVLGYLQAPDNRSTCEALVQHLRKTQWPQPLATAEATALTDLLLAPKLVAEEAEVEARPRQAQPDDASLELPADVNQDLLDGLLQELPQQAADFSAAIQRLAAGDGQLADVDVARRIAHTLKGAGNTVGVRGIATLTHHMEDILQALSKQGVLPNRPLADALLNAADCLETMSEALLGMSAPPTQALTVLQTVLDWANRIDRVGVPASDEIPPPTTEQPEPSASAAPPPEPVLAPQQQPAASTAETALRVSAHLVDDLLRLVGESIILTGQVQERIRKTIEQTRAVAVQNRLFQSLAAELEQLVDVRNVSSPLSKSMQRGDFDPLELEQYNELNTVTHRLVETAIDAREMNRTVEDNLVLLDSLLVDQGRLHRDSQEAVLRTRMVPIQTVVPRLQRSVRQTSRLVDKEAELVVRGADTPMDSNVLNNMVDPLMHILRNAVDHGIEPPHQRQRLGKPLVGQIELHFMREGNNIAIHCRDDGAGLDLAAIRRTAEERGLIAPDKPLEPDELARLILLPGFSTRGAATQTSGRGIGMDMVYSRLLEMKGSLRIQTEAGKGCLMELRLPVTLISTHALLLRMRDQIYALSDRGIEQILYSGAGKIQTIGKATTYRLGNDVHELTALETLLNLPPDRREHDRGMPPVLLVREETGGLRAVLVQEVLDSRDLVVKHMGQYIPALPGIVGATILGDGSVAPVLDLPELLRVRTSGQRLPATVRPTESAAAAAARQQIVLAVDDSLSARRSLAQFAQDAGFDVRTARDGLEAIEVIKNKRPDLVLADLEMPRMNGLELTAHLRANQTTHNLPVIMITSRSTAKHRHEAEAVGVDTYLTKPFMEDELLEQIHRLLRQ